MNATTTTATAPPRVVLPAPGRDRFRPASVRGGGGSRGGSDGWSELVDSVKEAGGYPTSAQAERVTRIVLAALGGHLTGDERVDLVRALPEEAARVVASQIPVTRPQSAREFVETVAARIGDATPATARWDVSSVLGVLPTLAGEQLTDRILHQLPPGYALLFGRAELAPRA
ncbi:DUF2267 domain-containing protein [Streptomyces sp. NPDC000345]|uniref:DUF2267 domain-containing protein n=1 Tax=Streptomyces sp. NPDC000345 TaxID=3364537 RepID=UPI003693AB92